MVTLKCPWCEGEEPLAMAVLEAIDAIFTCPVCGTSVDIVDEPPEPLERAA